MVLAQTLDRSAHGAPSDECTLVLKGEQRRAFPWLLLFGEEMFAAREGDQWFCGGIAKNDTLNKLLLIE